ncbi:hypothetical protein BS50DRAFT_100657 [Corynespora cassiicola Philippines]|uniref:Uncharacterized protein n=1 Tax=Corynespora cassiicola Philippines TaxID=1448308 RepID=A0A2T2NCG7_CORCC|nr:hypothetical protein BS50DRAFT_100657 [Corynespora cassiicola Philippines]
MRPGAPCIEACRHLLDLEKRALHAWLYHLCSSVSDPSHPNSVQHRLGRPCCLQIDTLPNTTQPDRLLLCAKASVRRQSTVHRWNCWGLWPCHGRWTRPGRCNVRKTQPSWVTETHSPAQSTCQMRPAPCVLRLARQRESASRRPLRRRGSQSNQSVCSQYSLTCSGPSNASTEGACGLLGGLVGRPGLWLLWEAVQLRPCPKGF